MGACGCGSNNKCLKLRAPNGWYVIEFVPGCDYCSHPPGILIHHPEAAVHLTDVKHMEYLPTMGSGRDCVSLIKCGPDPEEAMDAAIKCFSGIDVVIHDSLAEVMGGDFWQDVLRASPSVVYPKENKGDKDDQGSNSM